MALGIGKASLCQMAASGSIASRFEAGGLFACDVDQLLTILMHDGAAVFGPRALRTQRAGITHAFACHVFGDFAISVAASRMKLLPARTQVEVFFRPVFKGPGKDVRS